MSLNFYKITKKSPLKKHRPCPQADSDGNSGEAHRGGGASQGSESGRVSRGSHGGHATHSRCVSKLESRGEGGQRKGLHCHPLRPPLHLLTARTPSPHLQLP